MGQYTLSDLDFGITMTKVEAGALRLNRNWTLDMPSVMDSYFDVLTPFLLTLNWYTDAVLSGDTEEMESHRLALERMYEEALGFGDDSDDEEWSFADHGYLP